MSTTTKAPDRTITPADFEQFVTRQRKDLQAGQGSETPKAHIVNPPLNLHIWQRGMTAQDIVDIARTTEQFVVALCGRKWTPRTSPDDCEACEICFEIAGTLMRLNDE